VQHLETIAAAERAHKGLHVGGQARDGISLPACIASGERLAARITDG
jgi:oxygen-dependent protoporphyrinogen oxidase